MRTHDDSSTQKLRRGLAALAALTAAGWGATAATAAADPGTGNGNGNANGAVQAAQNGPTAPGSNGTQQHGGTATGPGQHGQSGQHGQAGQHGHAGEHGQAGHAVPASTGGNGNAYGHTGGNANGHANGQPNGHANGSTNGNRAPAAGDPPGNNGTVKITTHGEDDGIPQNTSHVSCIVDVEWYGFDEGADIVSTVTFTPQAPTADAVITGTEPSQVFVGGDPATGAGTDTGFDGEATYTLGFTGEPQPQQGYHVKLTIHTPYSQGADTKQKVFWVEPCTGTTSAADVERGHHGSPRGHEHADVAPGQDRGVMGIEAEAAPQAQAPGVASGVASGVPTAVAAGRSGSQLLSGAGPRSLLLLALGLGLCAAALVARRRLR
jgi:hypothetical protein